MSQVDEPIRTQGPTALYKRSYIDVILAWIDRLPGPTWPWFLAATLILVVVGTTLSWLDGTIPFGTFAVYRVFNDAYTFYPFLIMGYLNRTAALALDSFRPALGALEPQYEKFTYELTTMRRTMVYVATLVGAIYIVASLAAAPESYGISPRASVANIVFLVSEAIVSGIPFVIFIFFALRQLGIVVRLHRDATHLSLFETGSHNAFSRLTLRTSIGLALPVYVYTLIAIITGHTQLDTVSAVDLVAISVMIVGASVLFIWPLYGMHRRLVSEKARALITVGRRFESATERLHRESDGGSLAEMDGISKQLSSLVIERELLTKISTWPWEIETLRGFLSSIALPLVVWLATSLLNRFVL